MQVFETDQGTLRNVLAAIKRGRQLKCSHCGRRGATLGCRVPNCSCRWVPRTMGAWGSGHPTRRGSSAEMHSSAAQERRRARRPPPLALKRNAPPLPPPPRLSFHVACAKEAGCTYYCEQFQMACPAHALQFRAEARQQLRCAAFGQ